MTPKPVPRTIAAALFLLLAILGAGRLGWAVVGPEPPRARAEQAFRQAIETNTPRLLTDAATAWKDALAWTPADPHAWTGLAWAEALRGAPTPYVARLMARSERSSPHVPALARARERWWGLSH